MGLDVRSALQIFHHQPTFDREGAAALVHKAVIEKMDGVPNSFQLKGFATQHRLHPPTPAGTYQTRVP